MLANVYAKTRQFEKAAAAGKKGLSLDPTNSLVNALYGNALYNMGKFKEAIPVLKKAISLSPDNLGAHIGLTATYSLAGRIEDARAQAAEVPKINPNFSLEDIAMHDHYNFLKADKERFINALRKAGLK